MTIIPNLTAGRWSVPAVDAFGDVFNPSRGEVIARVPLGGAVEVDAAVLAAKKAFATWGNLPAPKRATYLFRYREVLERHFEELARLVTRENGKTLDEAKGDVRRGIEVVEFACGIAHLQKGESLPQVADQIDAVTMREPLGVCVGITPFNFPAMIPLWMFPLALVTGNTFVLKPSERVPFTAIRLAGLLSEAGLPQGVFNLLHGGKPSVDALLTHPLVKAVSFVGSTPVARYIHQTASQHGKRVQANGGAKNFVVVLPDSDVAKTVEGVMNAAFGCAGERCMAGSSVLTVGNRGKHLMGELAAAAKALKVGRTDGESQPDMGALITAAHRDRVLGLVDAGVKAGAKIVADGRGVKVDGAPNGFYLGATIVEDVQSDMALAREEVFGPVLNVLHLDDLEAAIALANSSAYGNGAAIFTNSGKAAREFKHRVHCGMIGINIGVPASLAMFPFSGWNDSFFGDLHIQGREAVWFYTRQKVTTTRWIAEGVGDVWRK